MKLFLLGDSSAAGVGTSHQAEALSGQLCQNLAPHFTLDWRLDAQTGRTTRQMLKRLIKMPAVSCDIAVTALGVNDITKRASRQNWLEDTEAVIDLLHTKFGAKHVYVSGIPRIGDFPLLPPLLRWVLHRQGLRYDLGLADMLAVKPRCTHIPADLGLAGLMAEDGFHPGPIVYQEWASRVAGRVLQDFSSQG